MQHLETLRAIVEAERKKRLALRMHIDEDLSAEAGMDGNLARLLQAARDLDKDAQAAAAEDYSEKWYATGVQDADRNLFLPPTCDPIATAAYERGYEDRHADLQHLDLLQWGY